MSILLRSTANFNDAFKQEYEPVMQDSIVAESELKDVYSEVSGFTVAEGPDGKQINIAHMFSSGGGVQAIGESDYLPDSTSPNIKQSNITIKQWQALVELSGQVMRRAKEGPAAFVTWANAVLPYRAKRLAFHQDRALMGAGTGILFQVNMATPASTALAVNNAYGISGLEGATNNVLEGDQLRFAADALGATLRVGVATVTAVNFAAGTIDIDALPTATANGDYVVLGGANANSFGSKENMGLEGIVDDGTNIATFQGLSRTTYKSMQGQVLDSTTANGSIYGGIFSEDLIEYADRISWERGLGKGDLLLANRSGRAAFWKDLKNDRRFNDPMSGAGYKGGIPTGGKKTGGPMMSLGDREVEIRAVRKCPVSRAFLLQRETLKMWRVGAGHWDDTTGSIWNRTIDTTARKDAFWATFVEEFEVGCLRPVGNVKITKLTAA